MIDNTGITYNIRPLHKNETGCLREFLYEAIFVPQGVEPPVKEIVDIPELKLYIEDFGEKKDDLCLVAECNGKIVGAIWTRIMNDYGHTDEYTPSLAISLYREYRNRGIGTRLIKEMINLLKIRMYRRVSLSVQKANPVVGIYKGQGFCIIKETDEGYVMVKELSD